jgi:serine protease Do
MKQFVFFVTILVLVTLACGPLGGEPEPEATVEAVQPTQPAVPGVGQTTSGAIAALPDLQQAVIQIQAEGSFVDPEFGLQLNSAGRGSGFIIDPSGIAVTNNHVVTGSALLRVWVGGETEPRNARILGVSECSDLAVIDIDGEGYPYFEWYPGTPSVGTDIYVAGFPLGDPEFTLTRGIISKERAFGETQWASVDSVLEYDATTNPGNSGGPVVDSNARVVAAHYAGSSQTRQAFGIGSDVARIVVERLRQGQDVDSIGINGFAVTDGEGLSGIWISSVKSGSPADRAGLRGGDVLTALEGFILATDGSMSDYCDILRSRLPTDTMNLTVVRYSTQEVLEGQLNGRALEPSFSFAQTLDDQAPPATNSGGQPAAGYTSYVSISDDTGSLTVEVPAEWRDIDGSLWTAEGEQFGWQITAATSIDGFNNTWTTPGMFFGASIDLVTYSEAELLDIFDYSDSCGYGGREPYEDPLYSGAYDLWTNCGGTDTLFVVVAATPESRAYIILVAVQVVTEADLAALDQILNTFVVNE